MLVFISLRAALFRRWAVGDSFMGGRGWAVNLIFLPFHYKISCNFRHPLFLRLSQFTRRNKLSPALGIIAGDKLVIDGQTDRQSE